MNCLRCGNPVPSSARLCPNCETDAGFPNVRLASRENERLALEARVTHADVSAVALGTEVQLEDFCRSVQASVVVIGRSGMQVFDLLDNPNRTYVTYHNELASGARQPQDNEFDNVRTQFESALFPNFFPNIRFGCLSLTGAGVPGYGSYYMVLKDEVVSNRTTVFECNPYNFVQTHQILGNQPFPPGFRAAWDRRHDLAKAKLHSKITAATVPENHQEILISGNGSTDKTDYVEAHIYGGFTRHAIKSVAARKPADREELHIWKRVRKTIAKLGGEFTELR